MEYFLLLLAIIATVCADRRVRVIMDYSTTTGIVDPTNGQQLLSMHAALHIDGTATDGAVRLTIYQPDEYSALAVDMLDYTTANNNNDMVGPRAGGEGRSRESIDVGTTPVTNAELADMTQAGRGLALDVWKEAPFKGLYIEGIQGCVIYCQKMIAKLDIPPNARFDQMVQNHVRYSEVKTGLSMIKNPYFTMDVALRLRTVQPTQGNEKLNAVTEYSLEDLENPVVKTDEPQQQDISQTRYDDARGAFADLDPVALPSEELLDATTAGMSEINFNNDVVPALCWRKRSSNACADASKSQGLTDLTVARTKGKPMTSLMIPGEVAQVAGAAAGGAAAVAFVIVTLVNGQFNAVALGCNAASVASLAFNLIPVVGWIIDAVVQTFLAIIPFLFEHHATLPRVDNTTEIIQYQMFADASKTGNEKCQQGNPQCQVFYGLGMIALTFGWELFDAAVFMIQFNNGYAMTIPDMAAALAFNGTANAIAVVDCHNGASHPSLHQVGGPTGDNPSYCNHAKYALNRDLITLPNINITATDLYKRMIPNPGGDCQISDPGTNPTTFAVYNITVTGLPVSIACNITAAINVGGHAVPLGTATPPQGYTQAFNETTDPNAPIDPSVESPANASTNGLPGAYVAPPPPSPFQIPFNATNSVCMSGNGGSFCFPNGTYDDQNGLFGFNSHNVTSMTVNSGSVVFINTTQDVQHDAADKKISNQYTTNQTSTDNQFVFDIQNMNVQPPNAGHKTSVMEVLTQGTPPPAACFFSKTGYHGDVFCLGVGGGNITDAGAGKTNSIMMYGNAIAYLFPIGYANQGEIKVTASIPDFSTEPYGTNDNFTNKVMAAWITAGT